MPCHTRMKRIMQGLLLLLMMEFGLTVMSLEPGFLDFDNLPDTNFSCVGKVIGGYYADLETNCQMFHVCTIGQLDEPMDIRFLCLNGTVFDQETRVCERIDEVDCSKSEQFYSLNLELYGNTQPPILEESPEIDYPVEIKRSSTTTTTTTTTTQRPSHPKSTSPPYYTTSSAPTTARGVTKVITSHHFPVVNSPDIRFNPEEINISLNPGAPPDISRSQIPISFQQQSYSEKNTRVTVTTHTTIYKNDKPHRVPLLPTPNPPGQILVEHDNLERPKVHQPTQTPKSVVSYGLTHNQGSQVATPTEINYGFTYQQTEENVDYNTEVPPHPYQYHIANLRPPTAQGHPYHFNYHTTSKRPHKINFPGPTTYRNHPAFSSSAKAPTQQQFHSQRTEKPPRLQLPLPLLPTLPPLTFSSPAPFSLGRHIETKRYTNDHQSPPRIIISASASVSDNSGRRLNYSLGTIGASHFIGSSPSSYDDYKEDDVGLDPFYHDVPKIKSTRHKRNVMDDHTIKTDQEAADLLRFLFDWYKKREKQKKISIPVTSEEITEINEELAPLANIESSTSTEEDYESIFRKMIMENLTETTTEKQGQDERVYRGKIDHIDKFIESEDYYLSPNLERIKKEKKHEHFDDNKNESRKSLEDGTHIQKISNTTPSNDIDLKISHDVNQTSTVKSPKKKKKRPRNQRRRNNKSGSTTRRTKTPKTTRKDPEVPSADSHQHKNHTRTRTKSTGNIPSVSQKTDNASHRLSIPYLPLQQLADISLEETSLHKRNEEVIEPSKSAKEENVDGITNYPDPTTTFPSVNVSETFDLPVEQESLTKEPKLLKENLEVLNTEKVEKSENNVKKFSAKIRSSKESEVVKPLLKLYQNVNETESELLEDRHEEQVETNESKQREHIIAVHDDIEMLVTTEYNDLENHEINYSSSEQPKTESSYETTTTIEKQDMEHEFNTIIPEDLEHITTMTPESANMNVLLTTVTPEDHETTEYILNYESIKNNEITTSSIQENNTISENPKSNITEKHDEYNSETSLQTTEEPYINSNLDTLEAKHYEDYVNEKDEQHEESATTKAKQLLENLEYVMATLHIDLLNDEKYSTTPEVEGDSQILENHVITEDNNNAVNVTQNLEIESTTPVFELSHANDHTESHVNQENIESTEAKQLNPNENDKLATRHKNKITKTDSADDLKEPALNNDYEEVNLEIKNSNINKPKTASRRIYETTSDEEEFVISPKLSSILRQRNNYVRNRKFITSSQKDSKNVEKPTLIKPNKLGQEGSHNIKTDHSISEELINDTEAPSVPDYVDDNYEPLTYQKPSQLKHIEQISDTSTHLEELTTTDELQQLDGFEHSTDLNEDYRLSSLTTIVPYKLEESENVTVDKEAETEHTNESVFHEYDHVQEIDTTTAPHESGENLSTTKANAALVHSTQSDQVDIIPPTTDYPEYSTTEAYLKLGEELTTDFSSTLLTTQTIEITTLPTTTQARGEDYSYETTKEPAITTTVQYVETSTVTPSLPEYHQTTTTENIMHFLRSHTTDYPMEETTLNLESMQATSVAPSSTTDSSTSLTSLTEPDYELDVTTPLGESTTMNRYQHLKTRLPWYKRQDNSKRKQQSVHRFSTVNNRRKSLREKPKLAPRITNVLKHSFSSRNISSSNSSTDELLIGRNNNTAKLSDTETRVSNNTNDIKNSTLELNQNVKQMQIEPPYPATPLAIKSSDFVATTVEPKQELLTTTLLDEESTISGENRADIAVTDAPLLKSANPTKAKYTKIIFTTTPLSKLVRVELRKDIHGRRYTFNCFHKKIHQFYSDPRDCRLFHYCTSGYTKNQMVDMKFVCDSGTYFDDEKLICTKVKPARCL